MATLVAAETSARSGPRSRATAAALEAIRAWVALPEVHREGAEAELAAAAAAPAT